MRRCVRLDSRRKEPNMINANTARLKTLEAININTFETINAIYKNIEDAISKGRYGVSFSITSAYNRVTGEASIRINSEDIKCNLTGIVDLFEEQGFKCVIEERVDAYRYTVIRLVAIGWE